MTCRKTVAARNAVMAMVGMGVLTAVGTGAAYTALGVPEKAVGPGCIRYWLWTTGATGLIAAGVTLYYEQLPGATRWGKAAVPGAVGGFAAHYTAGVAPFTRPITKELGTLPASLAVEFNLTMFTVAGLLTALVIAQVVERAESLSTATSRSSTAT